MQWLAELCVRRPILASVLILTLTVVGAFAFFRLGVDRFPKIDFPTILVTTRQPGAAPAQIETEVTDRIEEALNTISGIDELRSVSSEGVSLVVVSFVLDKDVDIAAQEVRDRVNRVLPLLPRTIEQPTVEKFDPDAAPVLTLAVSSTRPLRDVTEFADKFLRRRLENVNGVGQVQVLGGRARQVNIWLDGDRLRAYNLTVTDVQRALEAQNAEIPGGRIEAGPRTMTLRTLGRVQTVEEFGQIVIRQRDAHPITLDDVAQVEDGMADAQSLVTLNGEGTVVLQIRKQSGTNTVQVVKAVKERLQDIAPTLPAGYEVRVVRDQSEFIEASIKSVEEHLVLGAFLAAIVVLVFLWNLRSTLIAAVAIPTSIIASFALVYYMGFTLNSMTMLALTLAVGIVIDDAIVVLENIWRFIEEKGRPPFQAAIEATKEIGLAVLATTLSLVAIFIPIGFMGGIVGRFMKSFGLTMAFAIMVSLLVSFTLTPMMSARWLRRPASRPDNGKPHDSKHNIVFGPIDRRYSRLVRWAVHHRGLVAAAAVLVLLSSVPLFMVVNKTFLPEDDQSEFEIGVRAPEGTSAEAMQLVVDRLAARVREAAPEVEYTLATVGDDAAATPNSAGIYVRLHGVYERDRDQFEIMADVRQRVLPEFASLNLRTAVRPVASIGGSGNQNATLQFVVSGPDLDRLQTAATTLAERARSIPSLVDVDTSLNLGKPEVTVRVDRMKSADLGVQIADAANALRLLVGGAQVTTYNEGGEQYEVHLRARPGDRTSTSGIASLTVPSSRLGAVALENVAAFDDGTSPTEISRLSRQRQVTLYANLLHGESQTPAMTAIQEQFQALGLGPEYLGRYTGRSREIGRAAQNFLLAFVLSLIFMYLILAAQFESWLHPVTILLSLPLTLPFALFSIIVTRQSLNIFSALGLLVLFGVVKKNAILQIDHANQLREQGYVREEAVIQASRDRLRPILMTTLAFVAGMLPLVWSGGVGSGTNRAIGFVIIGGQTLVLLLTLVVTPVAYSLFDDAARLRLLARLRDKVLPSRAAATTAGAVGLALWLASAPLWAQGATTAVPRAGGEAPEVTLSLDDAVRRALEHNPDLAVVRLEPEAGRARVAQARSAFLPVASSTLGRTNQITPPSNPLVGDRGVEAKDWFSVIGVRERLPWGGGTWNVSWDASRSRTQSLFTNFNPTLQSSLLVAFSQPLLRDLAIDAARQQLIVNKRNQEISDLRFREAVAQTLAAVKRAYWDLVASRASLGVQRHSLELAQELERVNRARVEVGSAPPLDLIAAEAEVAARREQVIAAEAAAHDGEDRLRALIMTPADRDFWQVRLVPADVEPPPDPPRPDVEMAVKNALDGRLDLRRARKDVENARTAARYFSSQQLPDVRLEASYRAAAIGGTRLLRTGGFPGAIVGSEEVPFGTVLEQLAERDYPAWSLGLTLSYPIGRSYENAGLARARIEQRQAEARVDGLEVRAVQEIRQAARQVESTAQRIEATRAAADLADRRLDAERKRFEVGMSTSFLVVQAQRDLAVARTNLLRAQLDHQIAVLSFETLQQAPAQGGSLSVSGAAVVAITPGTPRGVARSGSTGVSVP